VKIHVIFTNRFDSKDIEEVDLKNCVCGVIDTIRATSTIAIILDAVARAIVAEIKMAFIFKKYLMIIFLCGEEGGLLQRDFVR
jgi:phosphosulfolactate phosphohydrolase-like enzyme